MTDQQKAFILELADLLEKHQTHIYGSLSGRVYVFVHGTEDSFSIPDETDAQPLDPRKLVEQ